MKALIIKNISSVFTCDFRLFEAEIAALSKVRKYDEYTYLHSLNVARLSVALGKRLGLTDEMIIDLGWAALLHDIGKLHVPLDILNKMKKFSGDELAIMQSHPVEALTSFAETHTVTLERLRRLSAAFEHHQRYDLKGYPIVQKKLNLHPFSRIVAIADTFDAMTTDRIYQRRVLPDVALKIMAQGFGTIFDPTVLQAFITCMGVYPVGSLVKLSNDELAVVLRYQETSTLDRPEIFLIEKKEARHLNLMDPQFKDLRILKSEFPEDHEIQINDILTEASAERESA
ncbi:MAG: HD-GYP domain-containing protein [Deltaproteobacteria bacterium]|nr:HD-GYP domain-containing protein [Deltaproteobacteria bacterium]